MTYIEIANSRKGVSSWLVWTIIALIGLTVIALSGSIISDASTEQANFTRQGANESQCDTWAERSTTAGDPDEADEWEKRFDDSGCADQPLDEIVDSERFIGSEYNKEDHVVGEDGDTPDYLSGFEDRISDIVGGGSEESYIVKVDEGSSESIDEGGSITYLGREENTILEAARVRYNPATGSSTEDSNGCSGYNIRGLAFDEVSGAKSECAYSGRIQTSLGERKLVVCRTNQGEAHIGIGDTQEEATRIC